MDRWFLFFKPFRVGLTLTEGDSLKPPFSVFALLTVGFGLWSLSLMSAEDTQKFGGLYYKINLASVVVVAPLSPLIGATLLHLGARLIMGLQGSLLRLIVLFYYAGVGKAVCSDAVFLTNQLFGSESGDRGGTGMMSSNLLWVAALGILLALYEVFVDTQLIRVNYSVRFGTALALVVFFNLTLMAVIALSGFGGFMGFSDVSNPGL